MPVQAMVFAEFAALRELLAYEEQLLAGMRVLIAIEQAEVGKLLPQVAGHFVEERVLAVNDFVMGEGQNEIFGEGVEQRKGQLVLLIFAVDRVGGEIGKGVVHPSHVPLQ